MRRTGLLCTHSASRVAACLTAICTLLTFPAAAHAGLLNTGDLIVADRALNGVLRIDPQTSAQTVLSSGGSFTNLTGVAVGANGDIYVTDQNAFAGGLGAVFRIDPLTGAQTTLSFAGKFVHPLGVTVAPNGDILVANSQGSNIIRVDPVTGAQSVFSSANVPTALVQAANGDVFVTDLNTASVVRIDHLTQEQITITTGGLLSRPFGIALEANGNILVADTSSFGSSNGGIIRLDPATGAQTVLSSGGLFTIPYGVAVPSDGSVFVADQSSKIIRVDPLTGAQTLISTGGLLDHPLSIAIFPAVTPGPGVTPVPEPPTFALFAVTFGVPDLVGLPLART
jgi:streptogramin lyase